MAPATLKYKLKKVEDDAAEGKPVCAFFSLPQGCRNGAKCPFLHGDNDDRTASAAAAPAFPKKASAGGLTKNAQAMRQVREELAQQQPKKRPQAPSSPPASSSLDSGAARKRAKKQDPEVDETTSSEEAEEEAPSPRAKPVQTKRATPPAAAKKAGVAAAARSELPNDVSNPFLAVARPPSAAAAPVPAPAKVVAPPQRKQQQQPKPKAKQAPAAAAAVSAEKKQVPATKAAPGAPPGGLASKLAFLPVMPFSIPCGNANAAEDVEEEEEQSVKRSSTAATTNKKAKPQPPAQKQKQQPAKRQVEEAEEEEEEEEEEEAEEEEEEEEVELHGGSKWSSCVEATVEHPRFASNYRPITSSKKGEGDWIEAKKHGAWCKDLPHVLALDCEMCATRDPVSMEQDGKALIRLSVVSGHDESQVLLDTLVLPSLPIVDYRSDIHGIRPEDLRQVMFTFRHAQAAMLHMCCTETVLVGHGLCNDLTSLKMKHDRVVDTALLFEREDAPTHTPALKDVACAVLGLDMPDMHDSVADAQVTLRIARHFLEQGPVAPVPRLPAAGNKKGRRLEAMQSCLLLHRIPSFVTSAHITQMFQSRTHVLPVGVDPVALTGGDGSLGRATARFLSKHHADLAFSTLTGPARPDKDGRPQKRVFLASKKDYVQVRLMYSESQVQQAQQEEEEEEEAAAVALDKVF